VITSPLAQITGRHLKAARGLLGWEQKDLAAAAEVALGTVRRMESFVGAIESHTATLNRVIKAFEHAGIEFLNGGRPGVRLTKKRE
jgi:predicted transcriptional regulator